MRAHIRNGRDSEIAGYRTSVGDGVAPRNVNVLAVQDILRQQQVNLS